MNWWHRRPGPPDLGLAVDAVTQSISRLDSEGLELGEVRVHVLRSIIRYLKADSGVLLDRPPRFAHFVATHEPLLASVENAQDFQPSSRFCRWLSANRSCLSVLDTPTVTSYLTDGDNEMLKILGARLVVPLLSNRGLAGLIVLGSRSSPWPLGSDFLQVVLVAAQSAAEVIDRAHAREEDRERMEILHRSQQLAVAGRLAADVAHEIRNPLTAIRLTIQNSLDAGLTWESRADLLEKALLQVDRIQDTVARLLNLQRPDTLACSDVDLSDIAAVALDVVRAMAQRQNISISSQLSQPLRVNADQAEIEKVLLNIFVNACQAMPAGGELRVVGDVVGSAESQRSFGRITVLDSGPGIPPDLIDRVFQPFFTTKRTGTGLGLAVSRDIVTRHDGLLQLENRRPKGTQVTLILPLRGTGAADG